MVLKKFSRAYARVSCTNSTIILQLPHITKPSYRAAHTHNCNFSDNDIIIIILKLQWHRVCVCVCVYVCVCVCVCVCVRERERAGVGSHYTMIIDREILSAYIVSPRK